MAIFAVYCVCLLADIVFRHRLQTNISGFSCITSHTTGSKKNSDEGAAFFDFQVHGSVSR